MGVRWVKVGMGGSPQLHEDSQVPRAARIWGSLWWVSQLKPIFRLRSSPGRYPPWGCPIWGLGRGLGFPYPQHWGGLLLPLGELWKDQYSDSEW